MSLKKLFARLQPSDALFFIAALFCLLPFVSSPIALILGFSLASLGLVPTQFNIAAATKKLLSYSIIGLGFGIHLNEAIEASKQGLRFNRLLYLLYLNFRLGCHSTHGVR